MLFVKHAAATGNITTRGTIQANKMAAGRPTYPSCREPFTRKDSLDKHVSKQRCGKTKQPRQFLSKQDMASRKQRTVAKINVNGEEAYSLSKNMAGRWFCPNCQEKFGRPDAVGRHLKTACKNRPRSYPPYFCSLM